MVPRAGKARAGGGRRGSISRRRPRPEDDAPDAFRDLLSGAGSPAIQEGRPLKRRKRNNEPVPRRQTIVDDSANADSDNDSDSDSDSDVEFEDVDLGPSHTDGQEPLQITIETNTHGATERSTGLRKRKPVTAAERMRRLSCHKMHIVCLLYHAFHRNHWCNDAKTQACPPSILLAAL
jgi:hypothetical protein